MHCDLRPWLVNFSCCAFHVWVSSYWLFILCLLSSDCSVLTAPLHLEPSLLGETLQETQSPAWWIYYPSTSVLKFNDCAANSPFRFSLKPQLSPSFTPTSVIRKMYATKEKSRDEPSGRPDSKEDASAQSHDGQKKNWSSKLLHWNITFSVDLNKCGLIAESNSTLLMEVMDGNAAQSGGVKSSVQAKEQERLRPGSAGHQPPNMPPSGASSSFPRPVYPVPLMSHVPVVRPSPQLHPNVVQRMLAQGIPPQQLGPALVQAGQHQPCWLKQFQCLVKM